MGISTITTTNTTTPTTTTTTTTTTDQSPRSVGHHAPRAASISACRTSCRVPPNCESDNQPYQQCHLPYAEDCCKQRGKGSQSWTVARWTSSGRSRQRLPQFH